MKLTGEIFDSCGKVSYNSEQYTVIGVEYEMSNYLLCHKSDICANIGIWMNNLYFLDKFILLRIDCNVNNFWTLACNFLTTVVALHSTSVTQTVGHMEFRTSITPRLARLFARLNCAMAGCCVVVIIDIVPPQCSSQRKVGTWNYN